MKHLINFFRKIIYLLFFELNQRCVVVQLEEEETKDRESENQVIV